MPLPSWSFLFHLLDMISILLIFILLPIFSLCIRLCTYFITRLEAPAGRKDKFIFASELPTECWEPSNPTCSWIIFRRKPSGQALFPLAAYNLWLTVNTSVAAAPQLRLWCLDEHGKSTTLTQLNEYSPTLVSYCCITNYQQLIDLKQCIFISSQFYKSEVWHSMPGFSAQDNTVLKSRCC